MTYADDMLRAAIWADLAAGETVATYRRAQLAEALPNLMTAALVERACLELLKREPWRVHDLMDWDPAHDVRRQLYGDPTRYIDQLIASTDRMISISRELAETRVAVLEAAA